MTSPLYYNQPLVPQNLQPQQPKGLTWVNGEAGANGFFVTASNSPVVLFDADNPVIYIKSIDNYGRPTMQVLDYTIRNAQPAIPQQSSEQPQQESNFVTKDDFAQLTASLTALIEEKLSYRKPNKKPYRPKEDESNE